jgi:hypothetical protein
MIREPYLFFVNQKRKHGFLYRECLEIYESLIQNSQEQLPIIGYERLNDFQTFFDIRNTLFTNSNDIFENLKVVPVDEIDHDVFLRWFNIERRDLMEELLEDLVDSFRYHKLFFVKETPDHFLDSTHNKLNTCNLPVRKVW